MDLNVLKAMSNDPRRLHKMTVNSDLCMGCRKCLITCNFDVYEWDKEKNCAVAEHSEQCVACKQCLYYCPSGAITMEEATIAFFDTLYDPLGAND